MSDAVKFSLPEVNSLDEVPQEYRAYYFEKDGEIRRQDPGAMASTMAKIRRENEKLSSQIIEQEEQLNSFLDIMGDAADPDSLRALKEKAARAEQLPTNDEVEKRIKPVEENSNKQLKPQ